MDSARTGALLGAATFLIACASTRKPPRAGRFIDSAILELRARDYVHASRDLDAALVNDFKPGDQPWQARADRLHELIKKMGLEARPEDQRALAQRASAAFIAYQAVSAFIDEEPDRAMLLAHAALGSEPQTAAYRRLLDALAEITGRKVERDQVEAPVCLANMKMQRSLEEIHARRLDAAVRLLRDALWLDPTSALAWKRLGSSYFAMGDRARAKAAYDRALSIDPQDGQLRQFLKEKNIE